MHVWAPKDKTCQPYDFTFVDTIKNAKPRTTGMVAMLESSGLKLEGHHHSGIDDARNIARCVIACMQKGFEFTQGMIFSRPY